jgi:ferredoxin-2, mitochondrial
VEPPKPGEELSYEVIELINRLTVTFVTPDGDRTTLQVREGDSLLDIAHEHDIDLEGTPWINSVLILQARAKDH